MVGDTLMFIDDYSVYCTEHTVYKQFVDMGLYLLSPSELDIFEVDNYADD